MKIFMRIIIWMMVSLTIQGAGLFYINNYLLSSNTSIKTKKIVKSEPKTQDTQISIPDNAQHINVSYDGKFLAYYDGDVLKVVNTKTGDEKEVEFNDGVKVSFYKWLPDRNRMLIAEKQNSNFKLVYYDVDKNLKEDIKDLDYSDEKAEVADIQISVNTNVICVEINGTGKRSYVYWINIMKEMKKVDTRSYQVGKIALFSYEDKLAYEDLTHNRIYITGNDSPLEIQGVSSPSILGVDENDNLYVGETENDKVTKIFYGNVKGDTNSLQSINLDSAVDKDNILITSQGKIYINDNLKGSVKECGSGKEYKYSGTFVQMYSGGAISVSDGKLIKTLFN